MAVATKMTAATSAAATRPAAPRISVSVVVIELRFIAVTGDIGLLIMWITPYVQRL